MKPEEVFKKNLVPKIALILFVLIAYEIIKLFPFMQVYFLGNFVINWLHLLFTLSIIGIIIRSFPGLREFLIAIVQKNMNEKIKNWSDMKTKSMELFINNFLIVIILLITYQICSNDLAVFLGGSLFDTLIRIGFLIGGLFFTYKAYQDFRRFLEQE